MKYTKRRLNDSTAHGYLGDDPEAEEAKGGRFGFGNKKKNHGTRCPAPPSAPPRAPRIARLYACCYQHSRIYGCTTVYGYTSMYSSKELLTGSRLP